MCWENVNCTKGKNKNPKFVKTSKGKLILLSIGAVCDSKTSRFIKKHEHSGLLSTLGFNTGWGKILLLRDILF